MASSRPDSGSPPQSQSQSHQGTPNTPSSSATPNTPASAPATLQLSSSAEAAKLISRRGKITPIACVACRQRKSKCDGARPMCQACQSRPNATCVYDVTIDQRKPSSLRQRVGELEHQVDNYRDILNLLLNALPDRLQPRFRALLQSVEEGGLSSQFLDDAKTILNKLPAPYDDDEKMEEAPNNEDERMRAYASAPSSRTTVGSSSTTGREDSQQCFNYDAELQGSMDGSDRQKVPELQMPMAVDSEAPNDWIPNTIQEQRWDTSPGSQPSRASHGTSVNMDRLDQSSHQPESWPIPEQHPLTTIHLFGKIDNLHPSQGEPVDLNSHIPVYLIQPLTKDDEKPLSGLYSGVYAGYRESKRQMIRNGANPADILKSEDVDMQAAFEPTTFDNTLPLPTWAAQLFGAHRNLRPSDCVACAWLVTSLMRWQISPTREHYERIPPWLRPSPKQCFVPHVANIDYLPWSRIRDALIDLEYDQAEVTINALSVNWPYADEDAFYIDQHTNRYTMARAFRDHITSLDNWTLASSLLQSLPGLSGLARFDNER